MASVGLNRPSGGQRLLGALAVVGSLGLGFVPIHAGGETSCAGFIARPFTGVNAGCGLSFYWWTLPSSLALLALGGWLLLRQRPSRAELSVAVVGTAAILLAILALLKL